MATISPTELACGSEPFTSTAAYLKLTITSITDGTAEANTRTIGWKVTINGTPNNWTTLHARYVSLGPTAIVPGNTTKVSNWTSGTTIDSGTTMYTNDNAGNLTLRAYIKQLFYYNYSDARWADPTKYQDASVDMVCSQLPRYANFTSHSGSSTLNSITVSWTADSTCDLCEYSLNGGSWTSCNMSNYTISGLSPGTSYNVRTRIRRTDSQLQTISDYLYISTQSLPTVSSTGDFNLGVTPNPTITISSLDYLTKWYAEIKDGSTQILATGNVTSQTKELVLNTTSIINGMLDRHSNSKEWTITVVPHCVSNGSTYNLTNITFKCTIRDTDYLPTFTVSNVSYQVTNSASNTITGSNQKVIKGFSDVRVTCTAATAPRGTTMASYSATSGTVSGATTNVSTRQIDLPKVNGSSVNVTATDNREQSTSVTKSYATYIDYAEPTIISRSATRDSSGVGKNVVVSITGTYCYWTGLSQSNAMSQVSIKYKLKSASSYTTVSGVNLTFTNGTNGTFTITGTITGNLFAVANEYNLLITIKDKICNNKELLFDIPTGNALIWRDLTNKRVGIKKKPSYDFDISGNGNIQNLYVNGTKTIWYS